MFPGAAVFQVLAVLQRLLVGLLQVLPLPLVFPAKVALHADIGPAVFAVGLGDAALEGVPRPVAVGIGGFGLPQEVAQIAEVLLISAALRKLRLAPLGDELLGRHEVVSQRPCPEKG